MPDAPVFADGIARTVELAERGDGEVTVLTAVGRAEADVARLEALFTAERAEEWAEFIADCAKFDAEIDKEIRIGKFTLAELEEEEQSLERLRRWHRELAARDVFGASDARRGRPAAQALHRTARRLHRAGLHRAAPDVTRRGAAEHAEPPTPSAAVHAASCCRCTRPGSSPHSARTASPPASAATSPRPSTPPAGPGRAAGRLRRRRSAAQTGFGSLADRIGPDRSCSAACSLRRRLRRVRGGRQPRLAGAGPVRSGRRRGRVLPGRRRHGRPAHPGTGHGRAFGSYGAWKGLGYTLGPLLGGVLITAGGYPLLFATLAVLAVVGGRLGGLMVPAVAPLPRARQTVVDLARRLASPGFPAARPSPWPPPPPPCPSGWGSCPSSAPGRDSARWPPARPCRCWPPPPRWSSPGPDGPATTAASATAPAWPPGLSLAAVGLRGRADPGHRRPARRRAS